MILTHEQPTWFDKCVESYTRLPFMVHGLHKVCSSYVIKKKKTNGKVVAHKVGKKERSWNHSIWVPRTSSPIWRGLKWCGFQRRLEAQEWHRRIWRLSSLVKVEVQAKVAKLTTWTFVAQVPHKVMVASFLIQASCSSIAFARLFAYIASPSAIYGGLLVSWF